MVENFYVCGFHSFHQMTAFLVRNVVQFPHSPFFSTSPSYLGREGGFSLAISFAVSTLFLDDAGTHISIGRVSSTGIWSDKDTPNSLGTLFCDCILAALVS